MQNSVKGDIAAVLAAGKELLDSGNLEAVRQYFIAAVEAHPEDAELQYRLGEALEQLNQRHEAEECYRKALVLRPGYALAANNLGQLLAARAAYKESESLYRQALSQEIDYFDPHINLGHLLVETNRFLEAEYYYRRAVSLQPDSAIANDRLSQVIRRQGRNLEARDWAMRATELDPNNPSAWTSLALTYLHVGDLKGAEDAYKSAIACSPIYKAAWQGLLLLSNYRAGEQSEVFQLHRRFADTLLSSVSGTAYPNPPEPGRRLRVGFVSGDLRRHSVSYFVEGVLNCLDRKQFQLWAYFNFPAPDQRTEELQSLFYGWRNIFGFSDEEVVSHIRDDRIDILIDLSGHTSHNRLAVFAAKPAPVQVTWVGYPNTTGLPQIDYRLTDGIVDPIGAADDCYAEKLWRLPASFLCYTPPAAAPAVTSAPCISRGYITFGSFNSRIKIGDACLKLWAKVLVALPDARLILKSVFGFDEEVAREELREQFVRLGIASERLSILPAKGAVDEHLALYGEVDIALDTFPYHGTTTTCEALWMGVPVVTRVGDRHASRVGASIMSNSGLHDLIAHSDDEFVDIACQLASDFETLATIRSALRGVVLSSRLLDKHAMARDVSVALHGMWDAYCQQQAGKDLPVAELVGDALASVQRLIIGGDSPQEGWQVYAAEPGEGIEFDGDLRNLQRFGDDDYAEIYCCHILQHVPQADIPAYVKSLHRILCPGGRLYLAVPDLDALSWLLCSPLLGKADKFHVMRVLFGKQADLLDFNMVGINREFLLDYLRDAGFSTIEQVGSFGLFDDASEHRVESIPVSLNVVAYK